MSSPTYIFTTLRLDSTLQIIADNTDAAGGRASSIYLLSYHHNRLSEAAAATSARNVGQWLRLITTPDALEREVLRAVSPGVLQDSSKADAARRIKVCCYEDGRLTIDSPEASPGRPLLFPRTLHEQVSPAWTAILDIQPTTPDLTTSFKTSERGAYDRARASGATASREVLLYNLSGEVMDASITTPYFLRKGQWVTPACSSGGQRGATRQWALDQNLCSEELVTKDSLVHGEVIWLSNALRGFFPATLKIDT